MIKINEGKQDGIELNHKNFPHLFSYDAIDCTYYQYTDFWWEFDQNHNFIVETTISDTEKLRKKIIETLNKQKKFTQYIIDNSTEKLNKINEMLEQ